jgi:hypothetical protein
MVRCIALSLVISVAVVPVFVVFILLSFLHWPHDATLPPENQSCVWPGAVYGVSKSGIRRNFEELWETLQRKTKP